MCASSYVPAPRAANELQSSPPESSHLEPASLATLIWRVLLVCRRQALLFSVLTLAVLAIQRAVYAFFPNEVGADFVSAAFTPIIVVVVNIQTAAALRGTPLPLGQLFDLALTRLWAVIIIDLGISWLMGTAFGAIFSPSIGDAIFGALAFMLGATTLFADVYASVEPQPNWLRTVPLAIFGSISLSWQNGNIVRVFFLAGLWALLFLASALVTQWAVSQHLHDAIFLGVVPLSTLTQAPLAALFTAVYLDSLARTRPAANSG